MKSKNVLTLYFPQCEIVFSRIHLKANKLVTADFKIQFSYFVVFYWEKAIYCRTISIDFLLVLLRPDVSWTGLFFQAKSLKGIFFFRSPLSCKIERVLSTFLEEFGTFIVESS